MNRPPDFLGVWGWDLRSESGEHCCRQTRIRLELVRSGRTGHGVSNDLPHLGDQSWGRPTWVFMPVPDDLAGGWKCLLPG